MYISTKYHRCQNTAVGAFAIDANTTGRYNVAVGIMLL
jgi:hypothetical protein